MRGSKKKLLKILAQYNLFCDATLIDIKEKQSFHWCQNTYMKNDFYPEDRHPFYEKCVEQNQAIYEISQKGEETYLTFFLPIHLAKSQFVFECNKPVSNQFLYDGVMVDRTVIEEKIRKITITDELTGVYNRRFLNEQLPLAVRCCAEKNIPISILFADLDFFKDINDTHGHTCGDTVLCEFAEELQWIIRENGDWVARYGGDEFVVCFLGVSQEKAITLANQIRTKLSQKKFQSHGVEFYTTCSIGVYTVTDFSQPISVDMLLRESDKRLYQAKHAGRNQVQ